MRSYHGPFQVPKYESEYLSNVKSGLGQGVKDKEGIKDSKSSLKMLIPQIIANLAPNFGLGLTKLTLFL
jgi:hypothetical protein